MYPKPLRNDNDALVHSAVNRHKYNKYSRNLNIQISGECNIFFIILDHLDEVPPSFTTPGERKIITPTSVGFEPSTFGCNISNPKKRTGRISEQFVPVQDEAAEDWDKL